MALGWRGQYYKYKEFSLNLLAIYRQKPDVKAFLEIILSLSTLIIFILFALKPTALTMISLFNEIKEKRATLSALNQKINDLQQAHSVYAQNEAAIADINSSIFTNPEPQTVSKQILGIAAKEGVGILNISIGKVIVSGKGVIPTAIVPTDLKPLPEPAQSMPLSISIGGNYKNMIRFVEALEMLRIPIKFDSVAFNTSTTERAGIVGLISARVPYLRQEEEK